MTMTVTIACSGAWWSQEMNGYKGRVEPRDGWSQERDGAKGKGGAKR